MVYGTCALLQLGEASSHVSHLTSWGTYSLSTVPAEIASMLAHTEPTHKQIDPAPQIYANQSFSGSLLEESAKLQGTEVDSIFRLSIEDVDAFMFWRIITLMLFATIVVDRIQYFTDKSVFESHTQQMLVQSIYTEITRFGLVSLAIFSLHNFVCLSPIAISGETILLMEYVNILIIIACFLLVVVLAAMFFLIHHQHTTWLDYEDAAVVEEHTPTFTHLGPAEYKIMARRFQEIHKLPPKFVYSTYLQECWLRDCLDVITRKSNIWGMFLASSLIMFMLKAYTVIPQSITSTPELYLRLMMICHLCACMSHIILFHLVSRSFKAFLSDLSAQPALPHSDSITFRPAFFSQSETPLIRSMKSKHFRDGYRLFLQVASLANTFWVAHFLLHEWHIVSDSNSSRWWCVFLILPLLCNIFVFLPWITLRLSILEAFYIRDREALDSVLSAIQQVENDLDHIRVIWKYRGKPTPTIDGRKYTKHDFRQCLHNDFGLFTSEMRARRIFKCLDLDMNGTVSMTEILQVLSRPEKLSKRQMSRFALW